MTTVKPKAKVAATGPLEGPESIIAGWGRERPDLDFSPMATIAMAFAIHDSVHRRFSDVLKLVGLSISEAATVAVLRAAGPPFRLTPTFLSRSVQCTTGGMTRLLDSLQGRKLVRRIPSLKDRRSLLVELTNAGKEISDRILELQAKVTGEVVGALTDSEAEQLTRLLGKLAQGARPPTD